MHRNSNITGNPISNFYNAGIFDFGHLQHIDFQRLFSYKNALTFTGKEKDSLRLIPQSGGLCGARLTSPPDLFTRFYYFGARYYDPSLSGLFLSVDPMSDKYPNLSPYAYCAWNPVKLVDPDGEMFDSLSAGYVKIFESTTNELIDRIENKANKSEKDLVKLKEYKSALEELNKLSNDKTTLYSIYTNVSIEDPTTQGYTTYGGKIGDMDIINILIGSDISTIKGKTQLAHELKHAYQFYSGDLIFAVDFNSNTVYSNNSKPLEEESNNRHKAYAPIVPNATYYNRLSPDPISAEVLQEKHPNYIIIHRAK